MSIKDEGGGLPQKNADQNPANENGNPPQKKNVPRDTPTFRAVEEHAAEMKLSAPVFAAVKQTRAWAAGKKVEKKTFEEAVKSFLNAPMGGK
jgi:hypothetical protein